MGQLDGKHALITGGARGFGRAMALLFGAVAKTALWLASDASRLVTGQTIAPDAGWIVKRGG